MRVGFAGLGLMGEPMAANLSRAGVDLAVYNRSEAAACRLQQLGARRADSAASLFSSCETVILMLADDYATDCVLDRAGDDFVPRVARRLIINMGTHSPSYSRGLEADIKLAGGEFVEAPVSGSRLPAEAGALIGMLAGDTASVERARPLLEPLCKSIFITGAIPSAMTMKLAVNLYLITTVAALAEAANLAKVASLDAALFQQIIASGPLRSDVAHAKLAKMVAQDFSPQASIRDVCKNAALVADAAQEAFAETPMLSEAKRLFDVSYEGGFGDLDMAAVVSALSALKPA